MLNAKIVDLEVPINLDGLTYTHLSFSHKTRMRDLVAMNQKSDPLEKECAMIASLAGVPFEVMLEATQQDMINAAQAVADLMGEPREPSAD